MERCANCNRLILFGGWQRGDYRFCNNRCLIRGELLIQGDGDENRLSGIREAILDLHEDVSALTTEVEHQRASLAEAVERLDFAERALVQLREGSTRQPPSHE